LYPTHNNQLCVRLFFKDYKQVSQSLFWRLPYGTKSLFRNRLTTKDNLLRRDILHPNANNCLGDYISPIHHYRSFQPAMGAYSELARFLFGWYFQCFRSFCAVRPAWWVSSFLSSFFETYLVLLCLDYLKRKKQSNFQHPSFGVTIVSNWMNEWFLLSNSLLIKNSSLKNISF